MESPPAEIAKPQAGMEDSCSPAVQPAARLLHVAVSRSSATHKASWACTGMVGGFSQGEYYIDDGGILSPLT
jgi:hypothetical protein